MEFYIIIPLTIALLFVIFYLTGKMSNKHQGLSNPKIKRYFKLINKDQITHDTYILNKIIIEDGAEVDISRKYTPISPVYQKGSFDLLIKIYRKNENPKFPEGGKLTPFLEELKIGDSALFSGPKGKFNYLGNGKVLFKDTRDIKTFKKIAMIAGGTGITPMYQVIQAILTNIDDPTQIVLLFANRTEVNSFIQKDILLRSELEAMAKDKRATIHFSVDQGSDSWKGLTGFVNEEKLKQVLPPPSNDLLICICGPPLLNKLNRELITKMGYNTENLFKF